MSHSVVHFEIPADDPEKLVAFYSGLFGWQINKVPMEGMDYWMLGTIPSDEKGMPTEPGGINGGLSKRQSPQQTPINYVHVESVDEYSAKATSLGATLILPKMPVPGMGWFAHFLDPQGNPFAIFQDDASAH